MTDCETRIAEAVMRERNECIAICERVANLIIALGVTGDAARTARDIAQAIGERSSK